MIKKKKILAIIPARGGSKGIKLKNLRKINGKSLIKITAEIISKIKFIDRAVISTDNKKIALEAIKNNLTFYKYRPKYLSGDKIYDIEVIKFTLNEVEKIENTNYDIVLMLHPTSPLRKKSDVEKSLKLLLKKNYDSVWTVSKTDSKFHPYKQLLVNKGKLKYFSKKGSKIIYRQQLNQVYHRNSVAYVVKSKLLKKRKSIITNNTGAYLVKDNQISIDTMSDLSYANKLLKR